MRKRRPTRFVAERIMLSPTQPTDSADSETPRCLSARRLEIPRFHDFGSSSLLAEGRTIGQAMPREQGVDRNTARCRRPHAPSGPFVARLGPKRRAKIASLRRSSAAPQGGLVGIVCESQVCQVTVHARGAIVTRRVEVPQTTALPDGDIELVIPEVTARCEAGSFRPADPGRRIVLQVESVLEPPKKPGSDRRKSEPSSTS